MDIIKPILSKLGASASGFCKLVQVGIDVYIPHKKYQVTPHSSPWFSAACAAAIVHRNHFFRLYQKDISSDSKVKFRQASNRCKRVLEAAKLAYANKTKESITSQKLGFLYLISVTPKMVKKVIMNLDLSKASGPDCIPVVVRNFFTH